MATGGQRAADDGGRREAGRLWRFGAQQARAAEARHVHRHALLDGARGRLVRDLPRQSLRLQGRHLVSRSVHR